MNVIRKVCCLLLLLLSGALLSCSGNEQSNQAGAGSPGKKTAKVLANDFQVTSDPTDALVTAPGAIQRGVYTGRRSPPAVATL